MSMLLPPTDLKRRRATRQLARNDFDTMIRAPVAGTAGNRSRQTMRAGQ
jgi:hypothetical protein